MIDENRPLASARRPLPDHPVRVALLDLLAELGTVTSTQAAARLGHSSGLCSFHLRQLAKHGLVEEAPHSGGRRRPWRLRWESSDRPSGQESPEPSEESFDAVVHLTPQEMAELAASVRALLAPYRERDRQPAERPAGSMAVAVVARLFPLPTGEEDRGGI
ncbi:ArsR/SmtB family transcription factor [Streptomyces griseus]|uniref:ArsR/SmtB family transcription factor n=1 Tax=Streptomyces griseus TaxID=1911 RepID=UPI0037F97CE9